MERRIVALVSFHRAAKNCVRRLAAPTLTRSSSSRASRQCAASAGCRSGFLDAIMPWSALKSGSGNSSPCHQFKRIGRAAAAGTHIADHSTAAFMPMPIFTSGEPHLPSHFAAASRFRPFEAADHLQGCPARRCGTDPDAIEAAHSRKREIAIAMKFVHGALAHPAILFATSGSGKPVRKVDQFLRVYCSDNVAKKRGCRRTIPSSRASFAASCKRSDWRNLAGPFPAKDSGQRRCWDIGDGLICFFLTKA